MFKIGLVHGDSYAVHTGTYAGEILIYLKTHKDVYQFLSIPKMENREVSKLVFENARNKGIIKFVERVPQYVVSTAVDQYKVNEKSNPRREQFDPSNSLDS